jgi:hypothetical protein
LTQFIVEEVYDRVICRKANMILCKEGLRTLIRRAKRRGDIHDSRVCRRVPILSHIWFAKHYFVFLGILKEPTGKLWICKNLKSFAKALPRRFPAVSVWMPWYNNLLYVCQIMISVYEPSKFEKLLHYSENCHST